MASIQVLHSCLPHKNHCHNWHSSALLLAASAGNSVNLFSPFFFTLLIFLPLFISAFLLLFSLFLSCSVLPVGGLRKEGAAAAPERRMCQHLRLCSLPGLAKGPQTKAAGTEGSYLPQRLPSPSLPQPQAALLRVCQSLLWGCLFYLSSFSFHRMAGNMGCVCRMDGPKGNFE